MDGRTADGWTDRHMDVQRETILPRHYSVAGYKNEKFQIKIDIFHISTQNIDCGSKVYPQSMFLSRNKKNNVYPCKPVLQYKSGV